VEREKKNRLEKMGEPPPQPRKGLKSRQNPGEPVTKQSPKRGTEDYGGWGKRLARRGGSAIVLGEKKEFGGDS